MIHGCGDETTSPGFQVPIFCPVTRTGPPAGRERRWPTSPPGNVAGADPLSWGDWRPQSRDLIVAREVRLLPYSFICPVLWIAE